MSRKDFNDSLKNIIKAAMDENGGQIELSDAKELIRPHFEYDVDKLVDKALASKTRYIIYALRDKKGIRYCFANDDGLYVDIEEILNDVEMEKIEKQIGKKIRGLMKAWHKIRGKRKELVGQITFDELDNVMVHEERGGA